MYNTFSLVAIIDSFSLLFAIIFTSHWKVYFFFRCANFFFYYRSAFPMWNESQDIYKSKQERERERSWKIEVTSSPYTNRALLYRPIFLLRLTHSRYIHPRAVNFPLLALVSLLNSLSLSLASSHSLNSVCAIVCERDGERENIENEYTTIEKTCVYEKGCL